MKRLFDTLTWKQILSIVVVAGGVIAGLVSLSHWNQERDFRSLYSSLSPEDAAAVLAKVREGGTEFRISDNGTSVMVPSAKVAERSQAVREFRVIVFVLGMEPHVLEQQDLPVLELAGRHPRRFADAVLGKLRLEVEEA